MKLWHRLSHLLGLNSEFKDTYLQDNQVWICSRCEACGKASNTVKLFDSSKEFEEFIKFFPEN